MKKLNRASTNSPSVYTERILQFGGGNFLRAFADWMIDVYNEKMDADLGILVVTPINRDNYELWQAQDGLYHVLSRGQQGGSVVDEKHLVKSVSRILHLYPQWSEYLRSAENPDLRFVISNTTEAGIRYSAKDLFADTPPAEFPAKLTRWLHHRYQHFHGDPQKGCIFIPVELILANGDNLRRCILQYAELWRLDAGFKEWISEHNIFCNTLVDRIVPGVAREQLPAEMEKLGVEDNMLTQGEAFHLWVIEGPDQVQKEFPLDQAGLNVIFTKDQTPYRTRKVRILNGAHTSMVPVGILYGLEAVKETVEHEVMGKFVQQAVYEEIIPTLDLPEDELVQYANDVMDRFKNPFIHHQLISISLNSTSKFKTRVLPSILAFRKRTGKLPQALVLAMAALVHFYKGEANGKSIPLKDDPESIAFLQGLWAKCDGSTSAFLTLAQACLGWTALWTQDLNMVPALTETLAQYLFDIEHEGMQSAVKAVVQIEA